MKKIKVDPSFMNTPLFAGLEDRVGDCALRALLGLLEIINSRNCDEIATCFLDEIKFRTKIYHQNKIEKILEYCNGAGIIAWDKSEEKDRYYLSLTDKSSFFFSREK